MTYSSFLAALSALALMASSAPLSAQTQTENATIVVTGKHRNVWDSGRKIERRGLDRLAKANKQIADYQRDASRAQSRRDVAADRADSARREFVQIAATPLDGLTASGADSWSKSVSRITARWKGHEDAVQGASRDFDKAQSRLAKAENARDDAQKLIDQGRQLMAQAELNSVQTSTAR